METKEIHKQLQNLLNGILELDNSCQAAMELLNKMSGQFWKAGEVLVSIQRCSDKLANKLNDKHCRRKALLETLSSLRALLVDLEGILNKNKEGKI